MIPRQKTPKKLVSIAIAMKTAEGICVFCDSRTTLADGSTRDETVKVHAVRFGDGNSVIVARVGMDEYSGQLIDLMVSQASAKSFTDRLAGIELVADAVVDLKNRIRQQFKGKSDALQRRFNDNNFELLVSYYFDGKPMLFTYDFALGSWTTRTQSYFTVGCGKPLADFLHYKTDPSKLSFANAFWISTYVIEAVKEVDTRCGGNIYGMFVVVRDGKSRAAQFLRPGLDAMSIQVKEFIDTQRASWQGVVEKEMQRQIAKEMNRRREELKRDDYIVCYDGETPIRANPETGVAVVSPDTVILVPELLPQKPPSGP